MSNKENKYYQAAAAAGRRLQSNIGAAKLKACARKPRDAPEKAPERETADSDFSSSESSRYESELEKSGHIEDSDEDSDEDSEVCETSVANATVKNKKRRCDSGGEHAEDNDEDSETSVANSTVRKKKRRCKKEDESHKKNPDSWYELEVFYNSMANALLTCPSRSSSTRKAFLDLSQKFARGVYTRHRKQRRYFHVTAPEEQHSVFATITKEIVEVEVELKNVMAACLENSFNSKVVRALRTEDIGHLREFVHDRIEGLIGFCALHYGVDVKHRKDIKKRDIGTHITKLDKFQEKLPTFVSVTKECAYKEDGEQCTYDTTWNQNRDCLWHLDLNDEKFEYKIARFITIFVICFGEKGYVHSSVEEIFTEFSLPGCAFVMASLEQYVKFPKQGWSKSRKTLQIKPTEIAYQFLLKLGNDLKKNNKYSHKYKLVRIYEPKTKKTSIATELPKKNSRRLKNSL